MSSLKLTSRFLVAGTAMLTMTAVAGYDPASWGDSPDQLTSNGKHEKETKHQKETVLDHRNPRKAGGDENPMRMDRPGQRRSQRPERIVLPRCEAPGQAVSADISTGRKNSPGEPDPWWSVDGEPAHLTNPLSSWVSPGAGNHWIQPPNGSNPQDISGGDYTYRLTIQGNPQEHGHLSVAGQFASDNETQAMQFNGYPVNPAGVGNCGEYCFQKKRDLHFSRPQVKGINQLEVVVHNRNTSGGKPTASGLWVNAQVSVDCKGGLTCQQGGQSRTLQACRPDDFHPNNDPDPASAAPDLTAWINNNVKPALRPNAGCDQQAGDQLFAHSFPLSGPVGQARLELRIRPTGSMPGTDTLNFTTEPAGATWWRYKLWSTGQSGPQKMVLDLTSMPKPNAGNDLTNQQSGSFNIAKQLDGALHVYVQDDTSVDHVRLMYCAQQLRPPGGVSGIDNRGDVQTQRGENCADYCGDCVSQGGACLWNGNGCHCYKKLPPDLTDELQQAGGSG